MSEQETIKIGCGSCKHSHMILNNVSQFECRRFPPSVAPVPGPRGISTFVAFPVVTKDLKCGEYQIKLSMTQ